MTSGECSSQFEFRPTIEPPLLTKSGLPIDVFEDFIARVNQVGEPLRSKHAHHERLIIYYILFGVFVVTSLSIALGIHYTFLVPLTLTLSYFFGFAWLVIHVQRENGSLLKQIHFNLCLVLRNENERVLYGYGIRARPGYLSKWIEFHRQTAIR